MIIVELLSKAFCFIHVFFVRVVIKKTYSGQQSTYKNLNKPKIVTFTYIATSFNREIFIAKLTMSVFIFKSV